MPAAVAAAPAGAVAHMTPDNIITTIPSAATHSHFSVLRSTSQQYCSSHVGCWCVLQEQRFGEVLSVAEGADVESMKKAVRKSRVVYNRGGADEQPAADPGKQQGVTSHIV